MSLLSLTPDALQALSVELADIAQRYNQYAGTHLTLRQQQASDTGEESICVVGEDEQGREWIAVKVSLEPPAADQLRLKIGMQH